jgi:hypothetical protein
MARHDDHIELEDVRLIWCNFAGEAKQYNREGDRNFHIVLDEHQAERLAEAGWNIKTKDPREEGDLPFRTLKVKVSYNGRTKPRTVLISSRGRNTLDEDTIELFDFADFTTVDVIIRPYDWDVNGKRGRTAYLVAVYGTMYESRIDMKYAKYDEVRGKPDIHKEADEFGEPDFD